MAESDIKVQVTLSPPLEIPPGFETIHPVNTNLGLMPAQPRPDRPDGSVKPTLQIEVTPVENGFRQKITMQFFGGEQLSCEVQSSGPFPKFEFNNDHGFIQELLPVLREGPFTIDFSKDKYVKLKDASGEILIPTKRPGYPLQHPHFSISEDQLIRFAALEEIAFVQGTNSSLIKNILQQRGVEPENPSDFTGLLVLVFARVSHIVDKLPLLYDSFDNPNESLIHDPMENIEVMVKKLKINYENIIKPIQHYIEQVKFSDLSSEQLRFTEEDFQYFLQTIKISEKLSSLDTSAGLTCQQLIDCYPPNFTNYSDFDKFANVAFSVNQNIIKKTGDNSINEEPIRLIKEKALPVIRAIEQEQDELYANRGKFDRLLKIATALSIADKIKFVRYDCWANLYERSKTRPLIVYKSLDGEYTFPITFDQFQTCRNEFLHYKDKLVCCDGSPNLTILSADGQKKVSVELKLDGERRSLRGFQLNRWFDRNVQIATVFTEKGEVREILLVLLELEKICNTTDNIYELPVVHRFPVDTPGYNHESMIYGISPQLLGTNSTLTPKHNSSNRSADKVESIQLIRRDLEGSPHKTYSLQPLLWSMDKDRHRDTICNHHAKGFFIVRDVVIIGVDRVDLTGQKKPSAQYFAFRFDPQQAAPTEYSQVVIENFPLLSAEKQYVHIQKVNDNTDVVVLLNNEAPYNYCMLALRGTQLSLLTPPTPLSTVSSLFTRQTKPLTFLLNTLCNKIFVKSDTLSPRILEFKVTV